MENFCISVLYRNTVHMLFLLDQNTKNPSARFLIQFLVCQNNEDELLMFKPAVISACDLYRIFWSYWY